MSASRRRPAAAAALVVVAVGLAHRTALLLAHHADLDAQIAANPGWYTGQHLPLDMLRDHLGRALLLLQQTPPLSNLVVGLVARVASWPVGVTYALIVLQAALSIATAVVLQRVLLWCAPGRVLLATAVAVAFLLDTDVIVLEYNSLGQTFYENLGMLLALACALALLRLHASGRAREAAWAGGLAACLALTRATWSFVAVPGALGVALLAPRRRARAVGAFLLPVVVLQGGWVLKNAVVYGRLTPATSSWTGYNLYNGLRAAGLEEPFRRFVVARGEPAWFVAGIARGGLVPWPDVVPAEAAARDRALTAWSGLDNPRMNGAAATAVFGEIERAFVAFAWQHPALVLAKIGRAYRLFWQPPATYGRMYLALFCLDDGVPSGVDPGGLVRAFLDGRLPARTYVVRGTYPVLSRTPAALWTLRWLEPAWLVATVLAVHVLVPLLAALGLVRWWRGGGRPGRAAVALAVCWALAMYVALVSSVGELGENMRFRLGVEPLFWVVTVLAWSTLAGRRRLVRLSGRSPATYHHAP